MGLTVTEKNRTKASNKVAVVADVTFDSSYPTGGEALTAAQLALLELEMLIAESRSGYMFEYDHSNSKLKVLTPVSAVTGSLLATVAAGTVAVLSTAAAGTGIAAISGTPGRTAAAGAEVANGTNLSSISTRIMAWGF